VQESDSWNYTWTKLKSKGWTWQNGSGLIDYYYLPPNGDINGDENVDYFTSAQNVLDYFIGKKESTQPKARTKKSSNVEAKKKTTKSKKASEPDEESVYSYYAAASECSEDYQPGIIRPNEAWADVWNTLRHVGGWSYKTGGGNISWYYIPPNGKAPTNNNNAIENQDYFADENKLKAYVMEKYNWKGDANESPVPKNFHLDADFAKTWQQLKLHGWKYNENNKTFVVPRKSSSLAETGKRRRGGGTEGVDFFKSKRDVVNFLKPLLNKVRSSRNTGSVKKGKSTTKGTKPKSKKITPIKKKGKTAKFQSNKSKQKTSTTIANSKLSAKKAVSPEPDADSTELVNDNVVQTEAISDETSSSSDDDLADERIVRPGEVIRDTEAWNILQRVFKFKYGNKQFRMPEIDSNRNKLANRDYFTCLTQLRKHLCSHGIPVAEGANIDDLFYNKLVGMPVIGHGKMALVRYLAMTNVPLPNPKYIPDSTIISDEEAIMILRRDCLEQVARSFKLTLANNVREFDKVEDLKTYICRSGFVHHGWNADEHLKISLWAADSPDINFFDGRKEASTIDIEPTAEKTPTNDIVLMTSPGNVSALPSPVTTPNKEQAPNERQDMSLTPTEQAKENMRNITAKGGKPVLKDDQWVNVIEKMKFTGWKHTNGKGLQTDIYILPNGSIKGKEHNDYLPSEYDAKCFAVENFGWGGDAKYAEEKVRRTLGTPGRKTRSPQPNIMTQSTPRKRSLYTEESKTPPGKRGRNINSQSGNSPNNTQTPQAKKADSTKVLSFQNMTPPTVNIVRVEPKSNMEKTPPITETAVVTESKRDKPSHSSVTANVQRNLSGAFDEQMAIGRKLMKCQLALQASYEMGMKNYYRKTDKIKSISGFLTDISQSISTGQNNVLMMEPKLLHILGPPGTGKTSTVRLCIKEVGKQSKLKKFNMGIWNAASIKSSNDLLSKISIKMGLNELAGEAVIEKRLKTKNSLFVAVIDEIDLILHRDKRGLQDFFKWAYSPEYNFALILISNTYENQKLATLLPSGWDISSKQSLVFRAYDKNDLSNILKARVNGPLFEDKALNYIATKSAADGGDARRALSIASRSITKYAGSLSDKDKKEPFSSIISKERAAISFKYVRMAITELDKGSCLDSIASLPAAAKIALAVATALSCAPNARSYIITRGMLVRNCRVVASHNIVNVLSDVGDQWVSNVLDQLSDTGLLEFSSDDSECHSPSDEKLKLRVNPLDVECSLEEAWPQEGYYRRISNIISSNESASY